MPQVQHDAFVYLYNPHGLFTYRKLPQYSAVWYPWEFGDGSLIQNQNVALNYDGQIMTAAPIRVPHNSFLHSGYSASYDASTSAMMSTSAYNPNLPSLTWSVFSSSGFTYLPTWGGQTNRSLGISASSSTFAAANTNEFILTSSVIDSHGAELEFYIRPQPDVLLASGNQGGIASTSAPGLNGVGVLLDSGNSFRVISEGNLDYRIQSASPIYTDNIYTDLVTVPRTSSQRRNNYTYSSGGAEPEMVVEFRLLGGRIYIRINDMAHVFSFIADSVASTSTPSLYITELLAWGGQAQNATLYSELLKWSTSGYSTGPIHSAPYSGMLSTSTFAQELAGSSSLYMHELDITSIDPYTSQPYTSTDGPDLRYKIDFSSSSSTSYLGNPYNDLTFVLRAYEIDFEAEDYTDYSAQLQVNPERVIVSHKFDPEALTIRSSAELHFNNFDGSWGNFMVSTGQVAIQIYLLVETYDANTGIISNNYQLVFTGYGHRIGEVQSEAGGSTFIMHCEDRGCQLHSQRWDLPRMDGWNQFYAASYLMQQGGITTDDMVFSDLIPPGPFDDLGDQFGQPAPFLPIGDAGSLLNRYANGFLDEIIIKQSNPIGYMTYPDVNGQFHFEKFQLADGIKRVFFDSDWEAYYEYGYPYSTSVPPNYGLVKSYVRKDLTQVRSDTAIIGINAYAPYWNPIIERRPLDPSTNPIIYDPTVWNYLGYPNPAVWVDGIFASSSFASNAADFMYNVFSLPGFDMVLPTAWLQPDIFPLDNISYAGDRITLLYGVPMMVTEVVHDVSISRAVSTITARYLPGGPNL